MTDFEQHLKNMRKELLNKQSQASKKAGSVEPNSQSMKEQEKAIRHAGTALRILDSERVRQIVEIIGNKKVSQVRALPKDDQALAIAIENEDTDFFST